MAQSTCLIDLEAPAPMMAAVLVCVVETGMPPKVARSRLMPALMEAAAPWYFSRRTICVPTVLMIFLPPTAVPTDMMTAQASMSHSG